MKQVNLLYQYLTRVKDAGEKTILLNKKTNDTLIKIRNNIKSYELNYIAEEKDSTADQIREIKDLEEFKLAYSKAYNNKDLVFGRGSSRPKILFLSEMPSIEDISNNSLFSGKTGAFFKNILSAMNLNEDDIYITNIFKFNYLDSDSNARDISYNLKFLEKEFYLIKPKLIVILGAATLDHISKKFNWKGDFASRRGVVKFNDFTSLCTVSLNYLLANESSQNQESYMLTKRKFWEDMIKCLEYLEIPISKLQYNYFNGPIS